MNVHFSVNFDHFIPIWNENCITPKTLCFIQINFEPIFIPFWNKIYKFHYKTEKCQSGGIQHKFIPILEWSDYYFSLKEKKCWKFAPEFPVFIIVENLKECVWVCGVRKCGCCFGKTPNIKTEKNHNTFYIIDFQIFFLLFLFFSSSSNIIYLHSTPFFHKIN